MTAAIASPVDHATPSQPDPAILATSPLNSTGQVKSPASILSSTRTSPPTLAKMVSHSQNEQPRDPSAASTAPKPTGDLVASVFPKQTSQPDRATPATSRHMPPSKDSGVVPTAPRPTGEAGHRVAAVASAQASRLDRAPVATHQISTNSGASSTAPKATGDVKQPAAAQPSNQISRPDRDMYSAITSKNTRTSKGSGAVSTAPNPTRGTGHPAPASTQSPGPDRGSTTATRSPNKVLKDSGVGGATPNPRGEARLSSGQASRPDYPGQQRQPPKVSVTAPKPTGEAGHPTATLPLTQTSPPDRTATMTHSPAIQSRDSGVASPAPAVIGNTPNEGSLGSPTRAVAEESNIKAREIDPYRLGYRPNWREYRDVIHKLKHDLNAKTEQQEASARTFRDQMTITTQQLETAQRELEALRGFLSTYDDASAEEVSNLLQDINDRIEETARDNANRWLFDSPGKRLETPLVPSPDIHLANALGTPLVERLVGLSSGDNCALFLLQSAWQACIVRRVRIILQTFSPVIGSTTDAFLGGLAQGIRQGESQPIYGRWRALTHKYLRRGPLVTDQEKIIAKEINSTIEACHATALLLFKTYEIEREEFGKGFAPGLKEVFSQTIKLATMLREGVVSRDYQPLAPPIAPYQIFDERVMERTNTDGGAPANDEVLCTIRLGMTFLAKQGRESTGDTSGTIFRPAEVLTRHCLEEDVATA